MKIEDVKAAKHLVFSGGGFKGFAYVGALKELRTKGVDWGAGMPRVPESITGCSVGALISFCLCLGYVTAELEDLLLRANLGSLISLHVDPQATSLDSGAGLRSLLIDILHAKLPHEDPSTLTFRQLRALRSPLLRIAVSDLEEEKLLLLDANATPDVLVLDALMASMSLPPIFPPVLINNRLCADGGLLSFFPLREAADGKDVREVLAFRLQAKKTICNLQEELKTKSFPIAAYLKRVYDVATEPFLQATWDVLSSELKQKTITLQTPDVHLVEFALRGGADPRHAMLQAGAGAIKGAEL